MKKRRELDALVSNGKTSKRTRKKKGHELLRSESDSSEVEFTIPAQKSVIRTRGSVWKCPFCSVCVPICIFILITICLLLAGALIWMQLSLRKDIDILRVKLLSVQSGSENTPDQLQTLHTKINEITKTIEDGKSGLAPLNKYIDNIKKQLMQLNTSTQSLSKGLAAAPELKSLPKQFKQITQDIATFENNINAVKDDLQKHKNEVNTKQNDLSNKIISIQKILDSIKKSKNTESSPLVNSDSTQSEIGSLKSDVNSINTTLSLQVSNLNSMAQKHHDMLQGLANDSSLMSNKIQEMESWHVKYSNIGVNHSAFNVTEIVTKVLQALPNEKSNSLNATSLKTEIGAAIEEYMAQNQGVKNNVSELTSSMQQFKLALHTQQTSVIALEKQIKELNGKLDRTRQQASYSHLNIDDISSRKDLDDRFKKWDSNGDGKVSVSDIANQNVTKVVLEKYDSDKDRMYTLDEIASALGFNFTSNTQTVKPAINLTNLSTIPSISSTLRPKPTTTLQIEKKGIQLDSPPLYKVTVPGIKTQQDLKNAFHQWRPHTNYEDEDYVTLDSIRQDLGEGLMPPAKYFAVYDLNHDDRYTLNELMMAFGLKELPFDLSQGRTQIPMPRPLHKRRRRSLYRKRNRIPL